MEKSEHINELATALAKAQGDIKAAVKDRANEFYGRRYTTLDAVMDACRGPLSSHGIAIIQGVGADEQMVTVTTMLVHTSGQWVRSALSLVPKDASPQAAGSAITYGRRYGLGAMVGVTAEEDDDGNAAQPQSAAAARRRSFATQPTVRAPQGGGVAPDASEPSVEALFPTADEQAERATLIKELRRLSTKLKMTDADKVTLAKTYIGSAAVTVCDIAGLNQMVMTLRELAGEPNPDAVAAS